MSSLFSSSATKAIDSQRVLQTEKLAREQIQKSHQQVTQAQQETQEALSHIQDQYEKKANRQSLQNTAALEKQKLRGYAEMRDLQSTQEKLLRTHRREGDRRLLELKKYYSGLIHQREQAFQKTLQNMKTENQHLSQYEQAFHDLKMQALQETYEKQRQELYEEYQTQLEKTRKQSEHQLDQLQKERTTAVQEEEGRFLAKWNQLKSRHEQTLSTLQEETQEKMQHLTSQMAQNLHDYESKQEDPFYQAVTLPSELVEKPTHYELTLWIPDFEQKNITLSRQGEDLLITGYRRHETQVTQASGKIQKTASYQSFSETFPLEWPIEENAIMRSSEPDHLRLLIPKKRHLLSQDAPPSQSSPQRLHGSRPLLPSRQWNSEN